MLDKTRAKENRVSFGLFVLGRVVSTVLYVASYVKDHEQCEEVGISTVIFLRYPVAIEIPTKI